ncbi:MAG: hypothetical protein E7270_04345 [Lachnospiraceae bacterium]|nr:hypothetical protein [Lachnospiraceae bacterium]
MKKISDLIQIVIFSAMIVGFMIVMFVLPDKDFSEQENRVLSGAPEITFEGFKSAQLMRDIESYMTDQFPLRDSWISMKSYSEKIIGKTENNGAFFCKEDTLISKFNAPDKELLDTNINAINSFVKSTDVPVYFSLIPGAVSVWEEKLPKNAQNYNQKALIEELYSKVECDSVDNYEVLDAHDDEYIYYRTDHHWTTLGAYYGYTAVADALGFEPVDIKEYKKTTVSDEFYGTIYSSSGVRWVEPDEIDMYVPAENKKAEKIVGENSIEREFYNYAMLEEKDKYTFFLSEKGGITPLLKLTSDCDNGKKLLIIRDSYSDCQVPFLTEHYSEIYLMDLRLYKLGVNNFIENNDIDAVLINYSVANFSEDENIKVWLGNN